MNAVSALLLPGTLCSGTLWAGIPVPDGTIIRGTLRGKTLAEVAVSVMKDKPRRVHLIGFSLGAIVAFEILRRYPKRVERLTLISANPHAPTAAQLECWQQQQAQVEAGGFDELAQAQAAAAGKAHQRVLAMARHVGPEVFLQQLELLRSRPDSRPDLAKYAGPLTLLVGENDRTTPPSLAEEMRALVKGASLQIIPGAGHYLPLDAPQTVSDVLSEAAHA